MYKGRNPKTEVKLTEVWNSEKISSEIQRENTEKTYGSDKQTSKYLQTRSNYLQLRDYNKFDCQIT